VYSKEAPERLADTHRWSIAPDGESYRRVVPSPLPRHILEIKVIEFLVKQGVTVICAGGGGIPVIRRRDGTLIGVEAVIDKDRAGALLAEELHADAYLMLTDVNAVYSGWGTAEERATRRASPEALRAYTFAAGRTAWLAPGITTVDNEIKIAYED
jgi:carbamate kinase